MSFLKVFTILSIALLVLLSQEAYAATPTLQCTSTTATINKDLQVKGGTAITGDANIGGDISGGGDLSFKGTLTEGSIPWERITNNSGSCPNTKYAIGFNGSTPICIDAGGKWLLSSNPGDIYYDSGRVGIKTNSPQHTLQVGGSDTLSNDTFSINSTGNIIGGLYYGGHHNGLIIGRYDSSPWPGLNGLYVGGKIDAGSLCIRGTCYSSWPAGPQGIQGPQGLPGGTGSQGPQGGTGGKGDKGDKGDTGQAGAIGPMGSSGGHLVVHSLSSTVPSLDSSFEKLWEGYSLAGTFLHTGYDFHNDLSSPDSCVPSFTPLPIIECGLSGCDFATWGDYSAWITTGLTADEGPVSDINTLRSKIGRCAVFAPKKPIIIKHDHAKMGLSTVDSPTGWSRVYDGYTLHGISLSGGYVGGTGFACMQNFTPMPIIECSLGGCDFWTGDDFAGWATGLTADEGPVSDINTLRSKIGRCAVFIKD